MKLQHRITLIFVVFTISIVLTVSLMEYYFANQNTFEDFYKRLEIRAIIAAKTEFEKGEMGSNAYEEIRRLHLETLPNEKEYFISLPVEGSENITKGNAPELPAEFYDEVVKRGTARFRDHDIFHYGYYYTGKGGRYIVVISAKNEFIDAYLNTLQRILLLCIIATVVVSLIAGVGFSNHILKPLRAITSKVQEISASQLHLRLPPRKGTDEISLLSETFNSVLDRLEATFETQKNFISNASHELNTPLTSIIGESEFALSRPRSADEYIQSLSVIYSEAERLRKITNSLLHLAQTGYSDKKQEFFELRLDEIIYTVKETVDNIIPENNVYINLNLMPEDQSKLLIKGNQQLLELAFANLVLNACKYSENKPVPITIAATNHKVIVIIEDKGIGIPKDEIAYIYEPFFRASNTGKYNGYGIGLPLTRNIIRLHNGILEVNSEENQGTKIKVTLPLSS